MLKRWLLTYYYVMAVCSSMEIHDVLIILAIKIARGWH
jgi:hypothetical protein